MQRFTEFDFGLTGLVGMFHRDWRNSGSELDVLDIFLWDEQDSRAVEALRRDAALTGDSLLSGEIETLWGASTEWSLSWEGYVSSGSRWMQVIVDRCDVWLDEHPGTRDRDAPPEPASWLADAVISEISELSDAFSQYAALAGSSAAISAALDRCVRECSSDLGFRFLLKVISSQAMTLDTGQYERFLSLGDSFHYGEFLVSDVEYLLE